MGKRVLALVVNDVSYDQRVIKICSTLAQVGYDVTVLGRDYGAAYKDRFPFQVNRVKVYPHTGPLMYWRMNQIFYNEGVKKPYDIIISNDFDTLYAGYRLKKYHKASWVFDSHELFTEVPELKGKWIKKQIWNQLGKALIPKVDLAFTVNLSLANILETKYEKSFFPIYNVPKRIDLLCEGQRKDIILYQGAVNRGRGLELAIEAMNYLPQKSLWIVGDGDILEQLKNQVERLQLSSQVKFWGRKSPEALIEIGQKAWVGLNLLEAHSLNYYYSLANKFFDYANVRIPSINMQFPEYKELLAKYPCGLMLEKLEVKPLVEAIESLDEASVYQQMSHAGQNLLQAYNWSNEAKKIVSHFNSL